ncbi:hypothetical protein N3K66_004626 [Trichothecium roseum]|uniref:Uncharacterized protein n=1 Tax=Trichothecium roseum TaxID=47278 RepID=A0ACC0V3A0_9HYPO|nr:hypothetical protein N3K66_004626 [Trichothecium roseum]
MASHKEMALRLSTDLPTHPPEAKPEKTHAVEEEAASESTISRQASYDALGEEMVLGKRPSGQATEHAATDSPTPASSPAGGLEGATEAAPKVEGPECMFMEGCDTEASLRKAISHFFGRNKACTLRIPEEAWIYWCRKHYQRVRYRNSGTYGIQQMELVIEQIDRLENWSTQNQKRGRNKYLKDWIFALRKRARNDPVPDWMRPLLGHVHSTSTVRWIAQRVLKEFEAGKIDSVPEFEFLPNILGEDDDEERQKSGRGRRQKRKASDAADEREEFSSSIAGSSSVKVPQKRSRTVDGVRPQYTNTLTPHNHAAATTDVEGFGTHTRPTLPPMKSRLDDNTQPQMTQTYDHFSSNAFRGNTHDQHANQSHATFSMPYLARSVSAGPEGSGSWIGGGGGVNNSRYRVPGGYAPLSMDQPSAHSGNLGAAKQSLEHQNQLQATSQPLAQFQARAHGNLPFWAGTGADNTTYNNVGSRARGGSQPIYHGPTMALESGTRDPRLAAYSNHMQQLNNGMNQLFGTTGASDQHHMYGGQLFSLDAQGAQLPATYANSGNVLPQTYLPSSRAAAAAAVAAAQQGNNRQLTQLSLGLSNEAPVSGQAVASAFGVAGSAQQFQAHSRASGGRVRNLSADSNDDDNDDDDGQGNAEYNDDFLAKYASARFD